MDMMDELNVEKILAATGSLAELCKVFYDECVNQGFEHDEALPLTMQFLQGILGGTT